MRPVTVPAGVEPLGPLYGGEWRDLVLPGPGPKRVQIIRDDYKRTPGFAVLLGTYYGGSGWWFFEHFEPAYVFSRAGRTAELVGSRSVAAAVFECRYVDQWRADQHVLWVGGYGDSEDAQADERAILQAWVDGVDPQSSGWMPRG